MPKGFIDTTAGNATIQASKEIPLKDILSQDAMDSIIEALEKTHPEYDENKDMWRKMGDFAFKRVRTVKEKQEYLLQGSAEEDEHFEQRAELVPFVPETPGLLSDHVGAIFSKPAQRTWIDNGEESDVVIGRIEPGDEAVAGQLRSKVERFIDDAGPSFEPMTRIAEEAIEKALVFGSVDAFLDFPDTGGTTPNTVLYTPEDRLDWDMADNGFYTWAKYVEKTTMQEAFDSERIPVTKYRVISHVEGTKPTVQLFTVTKPEGKSKQVDVGEVLPLPYSTIPIRTLKWAKGDPWILSMVEGDVDILRMESDLRFDMFMHAHPWILAWLHNRLDEDGANNTMNVIKLGQSWATQLNPGNPDEGIGKEDIQYIGPDGFGFTFQAEAINSARDKIRRSAGSDATMENAGGAAPESGVALAYKQAQRAKDFIRAARAAQEWEWQIIELVAGESSDIAKQLQIKYPDSFDQRLVTELSEDLDIAIELKSVTLLKDIMKELATKLAGQGETQATMQQIFKEIEDAVFEVDTGEAEGDTTDRE